MKKEGGASQQLFGTITLQHRAISN